MSVGPANSPQAPRGCNLSAATPRFFSSPGRTRTSLAAETCSGPSRSPACPPLASQRSAPWRHRSRAARRRLPGVSTATAFLSPPLSLGVSTAFPPHRFPPWLSPSRLPVRGFFHRLVVNERSAPGRRSERARPESCALLPSQMLANLVYSDHRQYARSQDALVRTRQGH